MASRRCVRLLLLRRPVISGDSLRRAYSGIPSPLLRPPVVAPHHQLHPLRLFSSYTSDRGGESDEGDEFDEGDESEEFWDEPRESKGLFKREKVGPVEDAAAIGYKVVGRVDGSEDVFKEWEPVYAVIQIGSHQFKVSNGDTIYTERLKHCDVNDKLILNKVLMLGSKAQTMIGRPILPDASVHAVVEEHALDAKVIIFKKKRRKNYRRTNGHRQELTRLRIIDIEGIDKPEVNSASEEPIAVEC